MLARLFGGASHLVYLQCRVYVDRVSEMEITIRELEEELAQRRDEASEAIAQWESHCGTLKSRVEELESELQAVAREKDEVKLSMEKSIVSCC
jgi:chromosome segregation ATPase